MPRMSLLIERSLGSFILSAVTLEKRTLWHFRPTKTPTRVFVVRMKKFSSLAIQNAPVNIVIRLREHAGYSGSSLGVRKYVYWRCGS